MAYLRPPWRCALANEGALLLLLLPGMCLAASQVCNVFDREPCLCTMENGQGLDLRPLANTFSAKFQGKDSLYYAWSPCTGQLDYGGKCTKNTSSVGCQGPQDDTNWLSIGTITNVQMFVNSTGERSIATAIYSGGTEGRQMRVNLFCGFSSPGEMEETDEEPSFTYNFNVISKDVCVKQHVSLPRPQHSPLSLGSILLIAFFAGFVLYFLVGIVYKKAVHKATGAALVPNKDLWTSLPSLIRGGFLFLVSPCRRSHSGYEKL